jgi:hypothetical protein
MNPRSECIVQFATRDTRAREPHARARDGQEAKPGSAVGARRFGQESLRGVGHLLLVVGVWLNRQAGESPRADDTVAVWGDRRVGRGTPSWT